MARIRLKGRSKNKEIWLFLIRESDENFGGRISAALSGVFGRAAPGESESSRIGRVFQKAGNFFKQSVVKSAALEIFQPFDPFV
jgi:hypothetical protein